MKQLTLCLMIFLTGCASMFSGSQQDLTIKTHNQAEIFINDRFVGTGYVSRPVARDQAHKVQVVLGKCQQTFTTQAKFNKLTLLGLFLDAGLFSIPTDFMTGAAWRVYPDKIKMQPSCNEKTSE
jgi:hypothetical protein